MTKNLRFIEKLEINAKNNPEAIALISTEAGKRMSYAELWEYSGRVYRFLKQNGVGKESTVMIAVPRGINPIITLIGVWRAGAAAVENGLHPAGCWLHHEDRRRAAAADHELRPAGRA